MSAQFNPSISVGSFRRMYDWPTIISKMSKPRAEHRRRAGAYPLITFAFRTVPMTEAAAIAYRDFFNATFGPVIAFTFTAPDDDVTYTVRFAEGGIAFSDVDQYIVADIELVVVG